MIPREPSGAPSLRTEFAIVLVVLAFVGLAIWAALDLASDNWTYLVGKDSGH